MKLNIFGLTSDSREGVSGLQLVSFQFLITITPPPRIRSWTAVGELVTLTLPHCMESPSLGSGAYLLSSLHIYFPGVNSTVDSYHKQELNGSMSVNTGPILLTVFWPEWVLTVSKMLVLAKSGWLQWRFFPVRFLCQIRQSV